MSTSPLQLSYTFILKIILKYLLLRSREPTTLWCGQIVPYTDDWEFTHAHCSNPFHKWIFKDRFDAFTHRLGFGNAPSITHVPAIGNAHRADTNNTINCNGSHSHCAFIEGWVFLVSNNNKQGRICATGIPEWWLEFEITYSLKDASYVPFVPCVPCPPCLPLSPPSSPFGRRVSPGMGEKRLSSEWKDWGMVSPVSLVSSIPPNASSSF